MRGLPNSIQAVRSLGEDPSVLQADPQEMLSLFADVSQARPDVNLIYRLDSDGLMLFHFPVGPGSTVGTDFSFRPYFQKARATLGPVISDGRISPTTNQPVATAVMPLIDEDGRFLGVVATNITLHSLSQTLAAIAEEHAPEERFRVSIVDGSGQAIAEPDPARLLTARQDELPGVVHDVLSGKEGTHIGESDTGEELLHAFVPIPSAGWGVIVERSAGAAFAAARAFHLGLLAAIGVFLVGGLLFWLALSRRVIQPLERLAAYSRTIGRPGQAGRPERDHIAPLSRRPDQMGHLTRSLERMERSVEERLRELETLLDTGRAVVSTLDSSVVLDRILEQTGRLTGADTCAIIALDPPARTFRVRASRGLSQSFIDHLRIDPSTPDSPSMRAIRTGEPVQVSDTEDDPSYQSFRERARTEGYRALLAVPLLTQHAPPATLVVYHRSPHRFTEREVRLVWSFATHAAMAIENSELFARSDEQLQEQTRRLESLIQSMHDALILEDTDGAVLYANRRACDLAGVSPEEALELRGTEILARLTERAVDPSAAHATLAAARASPAPPPITFDLRRSTRTISLRLSSFAVADSQGALLGRGEILQDITREAELDRMKSSLVATVSHELRTPLAAVKGYASTLLANDVHWDEQTQREFLPRDQPGNRPAQSAGRRPARPVAPRRRQPEGKPRTVGIAPVDRGGRSRDPTSPRRPARSRSARSPARSAGRPAPDRVGAAEPVGERCPPRRSRRPGSSFGRGRGRPGDRKGGRRWAGDSARSSRPGLRPVRPARQRSRTPRAGSRSGAGHLPRLRSRPWRRDLA